MALLHCEPWTRLGYSESDWSQYFSPLPQGRDAFVAEQAGRVTGIAVLREKFLFGDYLELFGIAEAARGRGIGGALLRHI